MSDAQRVQNGEQNRVPYFSRDRRNDTKPSLSVFYRDIVSSEENAKE